MTDEKPLSENIGCWDGGKYHITAGIWRTRVEYDLFDTFEIGIRSKETGKFTLLQSDKWDYQSVQEMANAVATILKSENEHYTPEWCKEYLT